VKLLRTLAANVGESRHFESSRKMPMYFFQALEMFMAVHTLTYSWKLPLLDRAPDYTMCMSEFVDESNKKKAKDKFDKSK